VNGRGISISTINNDIDSDPRSIVTGVPTDIGADEMTMIATPTDATMSGPAIGDGVTNTFTSGGRTVGQIVWTLGTGTLPTSVSFKYYPGTLPPNAPSGGTNYINSYWEITATGDAPGYTYNLTLNYTPAEIRSIGEADLSMAKRNPPDPWVHVPSSVSTPATKTVFGGGLTSFSQFTLDNNTSPLPIVLASFTAREIRGQGVRLDWRTLSEINNYGFFVQRRLQNTTAWTDVNTQIIPGHGTTNEPHDYTFTDRTVTTGSWQYRLKQVDLDGTEHFTEPINVTTVTSVKEVAPIEFALKQNYPNPFNPETSIKFSVEQTGRATLEIFNLLGQKVATLFEDVVEAGFYETVKFNASNLASGIYLYRLQSGQKTDLKKLMLIR
jgi:hypothetical protein